MKVPTSRRHFRKYAKMVERLGYRISGDTVLGLTREQMAEKLAEDPHLNNCGPLRRWDLLGSGLLTKGHTLNIDGEDDGVVRSVSQADAVCVVKHAVTYQWVGAEPEWKEP